MLTEAEKKTVCKKWENKKRGAVCSPAVKMLLKDDDCGKYVMGSCPQAKEIMLFLDTLS